METYANGFSRLIVFKENVTISGGVQYPTICETEDIDAQTLGDFVIGEAEISLCVATQRIRVDLHFALPLR